MMVGMKCEIICIADWKMKKFAPRQRQGDNSCQLILLSLWIWVEWKTFMMLASVCCVRANIWATLLLPALYKSSHPLLHLWYFPGVPRLSTITEMPHSCAVIPQNLVLLIAATRVPVIWQLLFWVIYIFSLNYHHSILRSLLLLPSSSSIANKKIVSITIK